MGAEPDLVVVAANDAEHRRQAEASTGELRRVEGVEELRFRLVAHAGAGVRHVEEGVGAFRKVVRELEVGEEGAVRARRARREGDRPALAAERLRRVRDQVEDDLSELRDVGLDRRRVGGKREREARLLRERALNQLGRLSRNAVDAYGLDDVLPLARVREHLLRQVLGIR